jgi:hypothetical protein
MKKADKERRKGGQVGYSAKQSEFLRRGSRAATGDVRCRLLPAEHAAAMSDAIHSEADIRLRRNIGRFGPIATKVQCGNV